MKDSLFTFEDIEPYTFIRWRGRPAWVLDKGGHIMQKTDARHIHIEYVNRDSGRSDTNIHENIVNRALSTGNGKLWVDFGNRLHSGNSNATA